MLENLYSVLIYIDVIFEVLYDTVELVKINKKYEIRNSTIDDRKVSGYNE